MHLVTVDAASIFQALADGTRIRLVYLLAVSNEEACLCELVDSMLEPQYKLSRHLKILKQCGLVTTQKEGRWVYHRLVKSSGLLRRLHAVITALPDTEGTFAADLGRFRERMCLRQEGRCQVGILREEFAAAAAN